MVARRYKISLLVLKKNFTTDHERRMFILYLTIYNDVFDDFPKISATFRKFPKILK